MNDRKSHFVYQKMFCFYSALILAIVLILEVNFIFGIRRQIRDSSLYFQELLCSQAVKELETMSVNAANIQYHLYDSEDAFWDVVNYLIYDEGTYMSKRLDEYAHSDKQVYEDKEKFIDYGFDLNKQIYQIGLVSSENQKATFYSRGNVRVMPWKEDFSKQAGETPEMLIKPGSVTIKKEIRDVEEKKMVGELWISFSSRNIEQAYSEYGKGEFLIYQDEGNILFSSRLEPDRDLLRGIRPRNVQAVEKNVEGLTVLNYINKSKAGEMPLYLWTMVILAGVILFVIGELLVNSYVKRFASRLDVILNAMEQIKQGNLKVRIGKKKTRDELDLIGENLNYMCRDLETYIEKSYLAEIAQKDAQMEAMQSQINPHFLYNTLEAIRMKAITNKDREVGKMLYGLAVIFRSQIKEAKIITIAKELYYCKKYMELYEFRHKEKFHFVMECPDEFLEYPILKFVVQPVIENYFVHGIRNEENDNLLKILVREEGEAVIIAVDDNGKGMKKEEIHKKNQELNSCRNAGSSIGIYNVQLRIRTEFGKAYGVTLHEKEERGLLVEIKIPKGEVIHV